MTKKKKVGKISLNLQPEDTKVQNFPPPISDKAFTAISFIKFLFYIMFDVVLVLIAVFAFNELSDCEFKWWQVLVSFVAIAAAAILAANERFPKTTQVLAWGLCISFFAVPAACRLSSWLFSLFNTTHNIGWLIDDIRFVVMIISIVITVVVSVKILLTERFSNKLNQQSDNENGDPTD